MPDDEKTPAWYQKAHGLASSAHAHQVDRGGVPYIRHLERVAEILVDRWPDATADEIVTALLHDVIEDGQIGGTALGNVASPSVLANLRLLTRDPSIPYMDYIRGIAESRNIAAIRVKLADLQDNSDPRRRHPDYDRLVSQRYIPAQAVLAHALAALENPNG